LSAARADGEKLFTDASQQNGFAVRMTEEFATVGD